MRASVNTLFAVAGFATFLGVALLATFETPLALGQDRAQDACSVATLQGSYGFYTPSGFTRPDVNKARFVPDIAAGLITFDGAGNFTGKATDVTNGDLGPQTPAFQVPLEGTYIVGSDCTGSISESNTGTHLEIILVEND